LLVPFFCLLGFFFFYATFQIDWNRDNNDEVVMIGSSTIIEERVGNGR
jgi:hypothetical protein